MHSTNYPKSGLRPIDELAAEICTLTGHLNAANFRWLMLIAEFDRRTGWSDGATQSCAHWLNWKCGIALGAAREKVRVARALENLPKVAKAMESGRLSYSKAREITRVADAREGSDARHQEQERRVAEAAGSYSKDPAQLIAQLEKEMKKAAADLDFETAARLRDELFEIRAKADGNRSRARSSLAAIRVER